jgi:hypothetical protein
MNAIARVWRGWTKPENAEAFESFLKEQVFPGFGKNLEGYHGAQLLKRILPDQVEFTTIMWFDSIESVRLFAGEDYETAHIDPNVQKLLWKYDTRSLHSEVCFSSI